MPNIDLTRTRVYFILFVIATYLVLAYISSGFYQLDEHFQILEFANYKAGEADSNDLPWEYGAKIRSAIQPGLAFLVFKFLDLLGLSSPELKTFFLRALSSALAVAVISLSIQVFKKNIEQKFWIFLAFVHISFGSYL